MEPTKWIHWVEIWHSGREGWNQVHSLQWETTDDELLAREYAREVKDDHPGSHVRVASQLKGSSNVFHFWITG